MKLSRPFVLQAFLCGLAAGLFASCSTPAGPSPVPCTRTTLFTGSRVLAPNAKDTASITTPATGHLEVTVDWVLASDFVSVALAQAPCSVDQLSNSACDVLFSQFSPPKPLANSTSLLRAGTYTLIVANLNPIPESVSTQVVLTSAGCAGS